jgi:hypothetical protein
MEGKGKSERRRGVRAEERTWRVLLDGMEVDLSVDGATRTVLLYTTTRGTK